VQLLIDRTAGAGALVERTRAGGVVVGEGETLRMEYVSPLADVAVNDVVVSSGLDGIYPKGFVIGRVVAVDGTGAARRITVRPSVDFSSLEEVLVVLGGAPGGVPEDGAEVAR
jgi:rod shape-determining protein MreC